MFKTKRLFPRRETAWDRFNRFASQADEPLIDFSELDRILEHVFRERQGRSPEVSLKRQEPKRGPEVVIDTITCPDRYKDVFEDMFGGKVKVITVPGKSEPPRNLREIMDEEKSEAIARTIPHGYLRVEEDQLPPPPQVVQLDEDPDSEPTTTIKSRNEEPSSIFDPENFKRVFGDCVGTKKFNEIFGLDENGKPDPKYGDLDEDDDEDDEEGLDEGDAYEDDEPPYIHEQDVVYAEDEEEDEKDENVKNPFVFIANRLTFLAQTVQPIIFDTSLIETGSDYIKIALNEDKTFPKIRNFDELGLITCKLNCCQTIRDEIGEFLKGTEYTDIFCFPEFISKDGPGTDVWAIKFICYKRK